jgi:type I restriction enzyme M protein
MNTQSSTIVQRLWNYCNVLRDDLLEDSADLPDPDVLAAEIVEDLRAALDQFGNIASEVSADEQADA